MKILDAILKHPACLILSVLTLIVALVPNILLCITEEMSCVPVLINILMPVGAYVLFLSLFKRSGWGVIALIPIFALCAFQIVVLSLYGSSIIAVDMFLNVVTTNVSEATELLGNLGAAIVFVVLLYLPVIVYAIVTIVRKKTLGKRLRKIFAITGGALLLLSLGMSVTYKNVKPVYGISRDVFPVNVIHNIKIAVDRTKQVNEYPLTSSDFLYNAKDTHDDSGDIYVLVIGETSRALNWQLGGYQRKTNPHLSMRSNLAFFPRTLSQSNTTHKSVPMLMSHITAQDFDSIRETKSIITAFKEAGYKTTFVSNQAPNHSFTEFFGDEADECYYMPDSLGHHSYDGEMLDHVRKCLCDGNCKQFVVLHSYGSHFKYSERYPADFGSFKPDECREVNREKRNLLINAYDNSIEYTDCWLDTLMDIIEKSGRRGAVVYASDHGEDILDDSRERFLHASPTPTYYQLHVAMLAWVNDKYNSEYPEVLNSLHTNETQMVSSTSSVFNTMLDVAGIATDYLDRNLSVASDTYVPGQVIYLNDRNEGVDITLCGLDVYDFLKLSRTVF